jgi:hypothetical protein
VPIAIETAGSAIWNLETRFAARFDLNHDGAFDELELVTVMLQELDAHLDRLYAMLDRDNDGQFSLAELTPASKQASRRLAQRQNQERKGGSRKAGETASRNASTVY